MKKIFILGLDKSGKTSVAKMLSDSFGYKYIDYKNKLEFRNLFYNENDNTYNQEYERYVVEKLKEDMNTFLSPLKKEIDEVLQTNQTQSFVIDGVFTPRDFIELFDYNSDIVVFLNRIDTQDSEYKNNKTISMALMRDYCFWMSSNGLVNKERWIEFNFAIPGNIDSRYIKKIGTHNTIIISRSMNNTLTYLNQYFNSDI